MIQLVFHLRVVQLYPVHPVLHPQTFGLMQIPPLEQTCWHCAISQK